MKSETTLAFVVALTLSLSAMIFSRHAVIAATGPVVSRPAPPVALADIHGKQRSLAELRGTPVVLCFYCGCQACRDAGKEWAQMQRSGALSTAPLDFGATTHAIPGPRRGKSSHSVPSTTPRIKAETHKAKTSSPVAVVVYMGGKEAALAFEQETGLDPTQTVMLPDADYKVTQSYGALPCPRLYVLDGAGIVRYINNHPDDEPQKATATAILSHVVDSLRKLGR